MIIKLINHVQVAEKFIGKELHVVVVATARALGELLILISHLLVGIAVVTAIQWRCNSQGFHGRLKLTVCRQQIVVLRLKLEWKIGRGWMSPQGTDGILHFVVVVIIGHRTSQIVIIWHAIPSASPDVLRSQQLRLSLLTVADWWREWRFEITFGRLRNG